MAKAPNPAHKYNFIDNIKQPMVGEWSGSKMYWRGPLAIKTVPSKKGAFTSKDKVWMFELSDFLSDSQY